MTKKYLNPRQSERIVMALYPHDMNKLIDLQAKKLNEKDELIEKLELENEQLKRERNGHSTS